MTRSNDTPRRLTLVAIDIAKHYHDVLIEPPTPKRRFRLRVANSRKEFEHLAGYLRGLKYPVVRGFEATGNYHRPLAYFLHRQGFELRLIPTLALARTREAMHNSWDKNDPKDAQVILHLLRTGLAQTWHDPIVNGINDVQELSKTHFQVTLARVRVWHKLRNHYFSLYFPEIDRFVRSDHSAWLIQSAFYMLEVGWGYNAMQKYEAAISALKEHLIHFPTDPWAHVNLAIAYSETGQNELARDEITEARRIDPNATAKKLRPDLLGDQALFARYLSDLRKAGLS